MAEQPQLAQVNVARLRHPADDPRLREFVSALARINARAEQAPGFVWRHPTENGHLDGTDLLGDPLIVVNLSVWTDYRPLHEFTYRDAHGHLLRHRNRWFTRVPTPATALWWIPAGQYPTPEQALRRLEYLRRYGPGPRAFTVRRRFDPDGSPVPTRGPGVTAGWNGSSA